MGTSTTYTANGATYDTVAGNSVIFVQGPLNYSTKHYYDTVSKFDAHLSLQSGSDVLSIQNHTSAWNGAAESVTTSGSNVYVNNTLYGSYSFSGQDLVFSFSSGNNNPVILGAIMDAVAYQNTGYPRGAQGSYIAENPTVSWSFNSSAGATTAPSDSITVDSYYPGFVDIVVPNGTNAGASATSVTTYVGTPVVLAPTAYFQEFQEVIANGGSDTPTVDAMTVSIVSGGGQLGFNPGAFLGGGTVVHDPDHTNLWRVFLGNAEIDIVLTSPSIINVYSNVPDDASGVLRAIAETITYENTSNTAASAQIVFTPQAAFDVSGAVATGNLTVTVNLTPLPAVVAETAAVTTGAAVSGSAGTSGTGALAGDTDANAGYTLSVSAIAGGAVGSATSGAYGDLTLNADGSFSYVAGATSAEAADIAAASGPVTDAFTFSVSDGNGGVTASSLTISLDATPPSATSAAFAFGGDDLAAGAQGTITLAVSDLGALDASGGSPTLTLNDGGTATYDAAASTLTSLVFDYQVANADNNVAALGVSALNLNGATITNASGIAGTGVSLTGLTASGPQIDTANSVSSGTIALGGFSTSDSIYDSQTARPFSAVAVSDSASGADDSATIAFAAANGSLSGAGLSAGVVSNGVVTYALDATTPVALQAELRALVFTPTAQPTAGGAVTTTFDLTASDAPSTVSDSATTVTVTPAVSALAETATIATGGAVSGTAGTTGTGALAGDSDATGYALSLSALSGGALGAAMHGVYGDLTLNADGSYSYRASADSTEAAAIAAAAGTVNDVFDYSVSDGHGGVFDATLTIGLDAAQPSATAAQFAFAGSDLTIGAEGTITLAVSGLGALDTSGGLPTLALNDGGAATYDAAASSLTSLVFLYQVASSDSDVAALGVNALNLDGATIANASGVPVSGISVTGLIPSGPQVDTSSPIVVGGLAAPSSGDFTVGETMALFLKLDKAVTAAGTGITLSLNDGGVATLDAADTALFSQAGYLVFDYRVAAGDHDVAALAVNAVNVAAGATVFDNVGNEANFSTALPTFSNIAIQTAPPTITSIAASGSGVDSHGDGDLDVGAVVTLTVNFSEKVEVAAGVPTLSLNDGGVASYAGGSGADAIKFTYTVAAGQNTPNLSVKSFVLNGATISDLAGNQAVLGVGATEPGGTLQVNTKPKFVTLANGETETFSYNASNLVTEVAYARVSGRAYTSYDVVYGANGKPASASYSNGQTATWTYNSNGSLDDIAYAGVTGAIYTGEVVSYNADQSLRDIDYTGVSSAAYTSYDVVYGANGKPASASYSNGQTATWTYNSDGSYETLTSEPARSAYSLAADLHSAANVHAAQARDLANGAGALYLLASNDTVTKGLGTLSVQVGADTFALNSHASEAMTATNANADAFDLSSGFGQTSIAGFVASGTSADTLHFQLSMFDPSWFSSGMTMDQEALALLSHATGATNTVITDSARDTLTLIGVSKSTLTSHPGDISFS